ncbi:MAG: amidase [Thermoleophilaceae bacterium]|nr:amidase [Thermoleophilaceae bacterium]
MNEEAAWAGLGGAAALIRAKEISARELTELYLRRIERIDPALGSYRVVFAERALAEADQADSRVAAADTRPMLGVPVAVKDSMDVAGELTPNGTSAHGGPAHSDGALVARLRSAGAVIIGKTCVPELCMWGFTETATFGRTSNPWDTGRTPGGSSGGSAAAVAAGLCAGATASDGLGSIRIPAALNGLFGLKPQRDRVPIDAESHWHGMTVFGGLTRTVEDAGLFLDVAAGTRSRFAEAAGRMPGKLRIAFSTKVPPTVLAPLDPAVDDAVRTYAELLRSLGHDVTERNPDYGLIALNSTARFLKGVRDDVDALPHPERLERRTRSVARIGRALPEGLLHRAMSDAPKLIERVGRLWDEVDVLITPVTSKPAGPVGQFEGRGALWTMNGQIAAVAAYTPPWNVTGQPAASVPAGLNDAGLPLAIQMIGRAGDEETLLSLGAQIQAERPWAQRRPPAAGG